MARASHSPSPPPRRQDRFPEETGSRRPRDSSRRHRDRNERDDRNSNQYPRRGYEEDERRRGSYRDEGSSSRRGQDGDRSYRDDVERRKYRNGGRDSDRDNSNRDRRTDGDHSRRSRSPRARSPRSRPRSRSPRSRPRSAAPRSRSRSRSKSKSADDKSKPNFAQSGLLAADTNAVKLSDGTTTVLKYNEPPEARRPSVGWRLYVFKGSEQVGCGLNVVFWGEELLHIHRQSAYLIGRDRAIADISIDHPSCSKQHAVIQHRQVQEKNEFGTSKAVIKPFIIDLESTNGTHVNDEAIPPARYYELKASDVIKFGQSTREYVLLHDDA
ncbi:SMAD/FHA domain-containing protein [Rickenella mellea]|uniref:SMAD/FHA domain-containing protein n=1 Tax=Rickenella mellea TaxID=50990 RepID=A0A4Y7PSD2_9AGAM|nr:SMAD/FHA domain-containing protein [Rickenella mellea]